MWALVTDGGIAAISLDMPAGDGWLEVAVLAHQSLEFLARVLFEVDS